MITISHLKYPVWAKIVFFPFLALWLAWLFLLGGKVTIKFPDREWRLT